MDKPTFFRILAAINETSKISMVKQENTRTSNFDGFEKKLFSTFDTLWEEVTRIYHQSVTSQQRTFEKFLAEYMQKVHTPEFDTWKKDILEAIAHSTYPFIGLTPPHDLLGNENSWPDMAILKKNEYWITITRPDVLEGYYREEFTRLTETYDKHARKEDAPYAFWVGKSDVAIPLNFCINISKYAHAIEQIENFSLVFSDFFIQPGLDEIDDRYIDGHLRNAPSFSEKLQPARQPWFRKTISTQENVAPPLHLFSFFDALRTDFSLQRLRHYTGTDPKHFQPIILLTNYQRYVEEFIKIKVEKLDEGAALYMSKSNNLDYHITRESVEAIRHKDGHVDATILLPKTSSQMPAYHYKPSKNSGEPGITIINIGVGPSNAKNITDHLAVLRPYFWLMIGHCGGVRWRQQLGQFVMAQAYVRDDHVLDDVLPTWVPVPIISELQRALKQSIKRNLRVLYDKKVEEGTNHQNVSWLDFYRSKQRSGTVYTTDNRNWELLIYDEMIKKLELSRAIAIDMESATIAANGLRYRIPYAALLCVSDRPLHGELKMREMAQSFYEKSTSIHLNIALEAIDDIMTDGDEASTTNRQLDDIKMTRKLRGLDDPLFR